MLPIFRSGECKRSRTYMYVRQSILARGEMSSVASFSYANWELLAYTIDFFLIFWLRICFFYNFEKKAFSVFNLIKQVCLLLASSKLIKVEKLIKVIFTSKFLYWILSVFSFNKVLLKSPFFAQNKKPWQNEFSETPKLQIFTEWKTNH